MKKIIATILGIEVGLIVWYIFYQTLIIYVFTGITNYISPDISVEFLYYSSIGITILPFIVIFNKLDKEYFNVFLGLIIAIPILVFVYWSMFIKEPNKEKEVIELLSSANNKIERPLFYDSISIQILNHLKDFTAKNHNERNNLHLNLFGFEEEEAKEISIDTLIFDLKSLSQGICIYSFKQDNWFYCKVLYFSLLNRNVKEMFSIDWSTPYGKTKPEALYKKYYELLEKLKIRHETNPYNYKDQTRVQYPTVIDQKYWSKTLPLDTINKRSYGSIIVGNLKQTN